MVYKRIKGGEWEEAVKTNKTRALVKGLKSHTKFDVDGLDRVYYDAKTDYEFQVLALNSTVTSIATNKSAEAKPSTAATTAFGASVGVGGSLLLPYLIGMTFDDTNYVNLSESKKKLLKGLSIATPPISIALSPITAPVLAVALAKAARHTLKDYAGDLTED